MSKNSERKIRSRTRSLDRFVIFFLYCTILLRLIKVVNDSKGDALMLFVLRHWRGGAEMWKESTHAVRYAFITASWHGASKVLLSSCPGPLHTIFRSLGMGETRTYTVVRVGMPARRLLTSRYQSVTFTVSYTHTLSRDCCGELPWHMHSCLLHSIL